MEFFDINYWYLIRHLDYKIINKLAIIHRHFLFSIIIKTFSLWNVPKSVDILNVLTANAFYRKKLLGED